MGRNIYKTSTYNRKLRVSSTVEVRVNHHITGNRARAQPKSYFTAASELLFTCYIEQEIVRHLCGIMSQF